MDDAADHPADPAGHPAGTDAVRLAAASLLAYAVFHHLGTWVGALGDLGTADAAAGPDPDRGLATTRWADWLDLLTPFAVLVPAALALRAAGGDRRSWWLLGVGALLYVEGHGIHLAANSVGNVAGGRTAHLWDEVVGHHLWYLGWYLVVAALVRAVGHRPRPAAAGRLAALALAVAVGATAGTNALEGGTVVLTALAAALALATGLRRRTTVARWLVPAAAVALLVVAGWGVWAGGFPQPSEAGVPPR